MFCWCCGSLPSWCCCGCCPSSQGFGVMDRKINLLMLGLDNSGKTCTAKSLVGDKRLDDVTPTVGFSRVETKYKGFQVVIFDLGGSKTFRSIWPKYYHEVHGFIFVVDSVDLERLDECKQIFRDILRHDKVRGKPLLLLCNKQDLDEAHDQIHIVDHLQVEQVVNEAKCPTCVEVSVANSKTRSKKKQHNGLKVGFKWLVKSIIANMADLGPRVNADVELEQSLEAKRRREARKRIEDKRKKESVEHQVIEEIEEQDLNPFVPITDLQEKWNKDSKDELIINKPLKESSNGTTLGKLPPIFPDKNHNNNHSKYVPLEEEEYVDNIVSKIDEVIERNGYERASLPSSAPSQFMGSPSKLTSLELEPIHEPKKPNGILKRMNKVNHSRVIPNTSSTNAKSSSLSNGHIQMRRNMIRNGSINSLRTGSSESLRVSQVIRAYTEK